MSGGVAALRGAEEAVERIVNRGGDAGDVLGQAVAALRDRGGLDWVELTFLDGDDGVTRLSAGARPGSDDPAEELPVDYGGSAVGMLAFAPPAESNEERVLLRRIGTLVSAHVHHVTKS